MAAVLWIQMDLITITAVLCLWWLVLIFLPEPQPIKLLMPEGVVTIQWHSPLMHFHSVRANGQIKHSLLVANQIHILAYVQFNLAELWPARLQPYFLQCQTIPLNSELTKSQIQYRHFNICFPLTVFLSTWWWWQRMVMIKWTAGATGVQYLYINVRGTLSRVVVIQSHHSPRWRGMLTATSPVPLCGEEKTGKMTNNWE